MKGIILAGGTGSRLYPLTKVTNKHLLPVSRYPMLYYPIYKLKEANITDILIVSGKIHMGSVVNLLGSGYDFGLDFTYKIQEEAGGIPQALGLAEQFVGDDKCVVILGDNIFENSIKSYVEKFKKQKDGAKILLKLVKDPNRFGIAELDYNDKIISIEEKPHNPKSNYAVTGIYMYNPDVFDIIKTLKPSKRGELEITDVNNFYLKNNNLTHDILIGNWIDAGTHEFLAKANELTKNNNFGVLL